MFRLFFDSRRSGALVVAGLLLLATPSCLIASELRYQGPPLDSTYDGPVLVDNSRFRYTGQDHLTFRTEDYLQRNAPHLLAVRPAIDTWSSQLGIHPRVLVEVLRGFPLGHLSQGDRPAIDTVVEVAGALAKSFGKERAGSFEPSLAASRAVIAVVRAFALPRPELPPDLALPRPEARRSRGAAPQRFGYFHPPWAPGETWLGGGAHGHDGSGVRNALDFHGEFLPWGSNVSQWWVTAMQAGTVRVLSSCSVTVVHADGWLTNYYHLDNIQVADGEVVDVGQRLSNYADTVTQATCQGGAASAPHVHMSVWFDGERVPVDQSQLDFTVFSHHAGLGQYDTNCTRSWYDHPTVGRVCPYEDALLNDALPLEILIFTDGFETGDLSVWGG